MRSTHHGELLDGQAGQLQAVAGRLESSLASAAAANAQLNQSETRYKGLVDAQGDAIFRRAADSRLTYGNDAFFKYADAVYANQAQLTPEGSAQSLASAVKAAGVDDGKVTACVAEPSTKAAVDASIQLGNEIGVNQTPLLFVNGRMLPFAGIPYDQLKQIIDYDLKQGAAN